MTMTIIFSNFIQEHWKQDFFVIKKNKDTFIDTDRDIEIHNFVLKELNIFK